MNPQHWNQSGQKNIVAMQGSNVSISFNALQQVPLFEPAEFQNCLNEDLDQLRSDAEKWRSLPDPVKETLDDCGGFAQIIPL